MHITLVYIFSIGYRRIDISSSSIIQDLKEKIEKLTSTKTHEQWLTYNGGTLYDSSSLSYYNIPKGSIIYMGLMPDAFAKLLANPHNEVILPLH